MCQLQPEIEYRVGKMARFFARTKAAWPMQPGSGRWGFTFEEGDD